MAAATILALAVTACNKEPNNGGSKKPTPEPEPEPEFVSLVTIDGNFDEWKNLPANSFVKVNNVEGSADAALLTATFHVDEMYINIYFEYDQNMVVAEPDEDGEVYVPFHVYMDVDNSDATGGSPCHQYTNFSIDLLMEGSILDAAGYCTYYPSVFDWGGEVGEYAWSWSDKGLAGVAQGAGKDGKYEIQITKEMLAGVVLADTFGIGIDIQQDWSTVGSLPNAAVTEENTSGAAPLAVVTTYVQ